MPISAKMKMHIAPLGNDLTWPKFPSTELPTWTFINNIQEEFLDLVATIRSDKCGGTTDHLGLIMSTREFALVPGVNGCPFSRGTHPGVVDYNNPAAATTVNQHTERWLENHTLLHVFEMEQMIEEQMKKHIMSCFHKDIYIGLKNPLIRLFEYLYGEYGEKTKKLHNKVLVDMEKEVDLTGPSITPNYLKQKKQLLFLLDTEQAVPVGQYIVICLRVIEKSNFINKAVLKWRRQAVADRSVALFWPFFKAAHKKERLKLEQGNDEQENSVML